MAENLPGTTEQAPTPEQPETVEQTEQVDASGAAEAESVTEAGGAEPESTDVQGDDAGGGEVAAEGEVTEEELDEARANEVAFSWQASEYVHHQKGPGWYVTLFGALGLMVLAAAILHLWLEIGLFVVMGAAVIVYAAKAPRTLMYELTPNGIVIEGKDHPYEEFRSFGVLTDEEWHTIDLEPTKRFSPRLSILFDSDDFDSIVGHLELHLPRADRDPDPIERLSRYLRF